MRTLCNKNYRDIFKKDNYYKVEFHDGFCIVGYNGGQQIFETRRYAYPRYDYFFDYFYDNKELRKLKLKQIDDNN